MTQFNSQSLSLFLTSLLDLLWPIATILTLGYGGYRVSNGNLSIGELLSFMWYIQWAINPISQLAKYNNQIQSSFISCKRVEELLSKFDNTFTNTVKNEMVNTVELQNVSFNYPNSSIGVESVSLKLKKGVVYSLVGESGSGKSTLSKILSGLYELDSGLIKINNNPVDYPSMRNNKNISIAFNDPYIFSDTLFNNIFLFSTENYDDKILQMANIDPLSFGDGEKFIGSGNSGLSSGQKQRIELARIMNQDPDVLIIDETTSALDSAIEDHILKNIFSLKSKKIIVIISHRLSTVLKTDHCYFMKEGKLVMDGKPRELLNEETSFKDLFKTQKI